MENYFWLLSDGKSIARCEQLDQDGAPMPNQQKIVEKDARIQAILNRPDPK